MKKGVLLLILALSALSIAIAQEDVPEAVENRLPIEFHSVTGNESVTFDLVRYFGRNYDFVVSQTEHVDVTINPDGVATLKTSNPEWRGIETVVFATDEKYLEIEAQPTKDLLPRRYRNLTKINVTADKVALVSDAFTQEQFNTIIGKLSGEQVDIVSFISNKSLSMDINDELTINFSTENRVNNLPGMDFTFKMPEGNLTAAQYAGRNDLLHFSLIMFGLAALIILGVYMKYSWAGPFREVFLKPKQKTEVSKSDKYKKDLQKNLRKINSLIGKEKPDRLYKKAMSFGKLFLSKGYGIKSSNYKKKLEKADINSGAKSKIKVLFTKYKDKIYKGSQIKDSDVKKLVSFIRSIARDL